MKYQRILLKIIEEEIDRFLTEQAAPPAAPTPPADPSAVAPPEGAGDTAGEDDSGEGGGSEIKTALETLAAKTPIDIKKTILSSLQNGAERPDAETLVAYVQNKLEEPKEESDEEDDTETPVPNNVKKAVSHIVKTFKFKVPEKAEKEAKKEEEKDDESEETPSAATPAPGAPAAPTPPATPPVTESRLQTSLREYLMFKQLSKKVKRK